MALTIILTIVIFLLLILLLVGILLFAKSKLSPSGKIKILINGEKEIEVVLKRLVPELREA